MKPSALDRCIRAFHKYNQEASTPPVTTARAREESILRHGLSEASKELAYVLRSKAARGVYPFAPKGARRTSSTFRLMVEAA